MTNIRTVIISFLFFFTTVIWMLPARANRPVPKTQNPGPVPVVSQAVGFAISPAIRDLPPVEPAKPDPEAEQNIKSNPNKIIRAEVENPNTFSSDPVVQSSSPELLTPAPSTNFDGLSNQDNFNLFGFRVSPPDTDGDVGPNHYVQIINLAYRVFDKTGTPLTPARKVSSIFTALGPPCGDRDDGDPIVLYDPLADRWLISQFCTVADPFNHQVIAISMTGDPTGQYFLYDFQMPNNKFNDYPKFGVWPDAYYMTDNQFNQAGTAFLGAGAFAFDRAKMLIGDPTATYIYFDVENGNPAIGGMLPSDFDGLKPPPPGTPNYFSYFTADEFGDPSDAMRIFEFRPDFDNPANSTFTEWADSPVPVASFDPRSPVGRRDIEQPPPAGSTNYLDSISDRLMFRLQYRSSSAHESLVVTHTVNVSGVTPSTPATHQAGVRYYELRRNFSGGGFFVQEQATFAPDSDNRWMGSAAIDHQGNLAVGYSVSSLTVFPSIRYAGRLATDPPNGLFQGEATLIAGSGVQLTTSNRWGDYSAMSVDPTDECTFWYTQEYYTAASQATSVAGWLTHIGKFKFDECTPAPQGALQGTITNCLTGQPVEGAIVQVSNGFSGTSDASGNYSRNLGPGTYDVSATAPGFLPGTANGVVITDGETTIVNLCITPMPIIMEAGSTLAAEDCDPATGAIDPGEMVTVDLSLKNVGTSDTTNLVATLLATGGVTSPSGPQNYGVVMVGGSAVTRSFSFTADSNLACGSELTATLQLQDGANNLGMVSYTFNLGSLGNPSTASYSSGGVLVPIPDLGTAEVPINVPDAKVIDDVNVRVRLNHTFDGDLIIASSIQTGPP